MYSMIYLKISKENAIILLGERIDAIPAIKKDQNGLEYYDFIRWCSKTWQTVDEIYGSDDPHSEELRGLGLSNCSCNAQVVALILAEAYHTRLEEFINEIRTGMKVPE